MIFQQENAPTGWTRDNSNTNERALRVVRGDSNWSGSGPSSGGVNFTDAFSGSRSLSGTVGNRTLTKTQLPAILGRFGIDAFINGVGDFTNPTGSASRFINNSGGNGPGTNVCTLDIGDASTHNHTFSGSVNLNVKYLDVIIAVKD